MDEEPLASPMSRIKAHVESCRFQGMSCERWTTKHETQLTWAMDKINKARRERDELLMKVEELSERVVEHRIRNLLSMPDYMDLSTELIENELDAQVADGEKALELMLSLIRKTIALLEPMVEKLKTKPR